MAPKVNPPLFILDLEEPLEEISEAKKIIITYDNQRKVKFIKNQKDDEFYSNLTAHLLKMAKEYKWEFKEIVVLFG